MARGLHLEFASTPERTAGDGVILTGDFSASALEAPFPEGVQSNLLPQVFHYVGARNKAAILTQSGEEIARK